jgi:hypothetical protein
LIWPPRDQPTNGGGGEAPDCAAFYREHNSRRR